ncbi:MAG: hypothetical protein RBR34_04445 [Rhodospirillaceae bacterium]|nr:hypothetical protein [Rhodospirillaceae bacterium]
MAEPDLTPFALSRIYAEGWNAGRGTGLDLPEDDLDRLAERDNPHDASAARERWTQGFKDGVRRNGAPDQKRRKDTRF